jgi:serine/threonine-protein kinase
MSDAATRLTAALADRYRIERELGAGGMATVYLAHDLKHDRQVAIKVLRPELAAVIGAERFLSEIKTTANLQHPHILPLFDSGQAVGRSGGATDGPAAEYLFYVMPYVEGESLRDRLSREKQLPIHDAVRIATEVASALDYAHRHNVIHRDIKPENILLHDGRALVADFGIALAASKAGGSRMTETGMSLGTPTYMSPEQAMGEREITARSDVYALGCVLYEMLVGDPPFLGGTAQAIVAKVMTEKPAPPSRMRDTVPPAVEDAVLTALEKLPADRFATAAEFAAAVAGGTTARATTRAAHGVTPVEGPWRRVGILLGAACLALLALTSWALRRGATSAGPMVYDAALPDSAPMTFAATTATASYGASLRNLSVSTAGGFAVYAARQGDSTFLWYRSLRDATMHPIPGSRGATSPRLSPDGSRVAYLVGDQTLVLPVGGGEPRRLLDGKSIMAMDWLSNQQLFAADADGNRMNWLDPEGGTVRSKRIPRCVFGQWIPELKQLICSYNRTATLLDPEAGGRWNILTSLSGGAAGPALVGSAFRLIDKRYLVYLGMDGSLMAAAYDPVRHQVLRSVALVTGVRREAIGEAQYDLSGDGTLLYAPGVDATLGRMVSLHSGGTPQPLPVETADFQRYDLSRDRRWLAAVVQATDGMELRIYDLRNGQRYAWLTREVLRHPLWSSDGLRLLVATRDSVQWRLELGAPSSGVPPQTLVAFGTDPANALPVNPDPVDWHDDHTALAMDWGASIVLHFDPAAAKPVFDTVATGGRFASLSPNGKLLLSQTTDGNRIVVSSFPVAGRQWQISSDGVEPLWLSPTEVLYRAGVSWFVAHVNPETGEPAGAATFWARDPRFSDTSGWSNRVSQDGGIIYVQGPAQTTTSYLRVVPNWVGRMKAAVDSVNR